MSHQIGLQVESISKKYKGSRHYANKELTCSFESGQITALLGHNGAGKTTLLHQIVGLVRPDAGDICYGELSFVQSPRLARTKIAMMPQLHAPLKGVTVREAISAIGSLRGLRGERLKKDVEDLLSELDITEWGDITGERLSGGLKRLTSFAMTVIAAAPIILLDEPTNDVDPIRRKKLWLYLRQLAKKGHLIVIVTHNLLEVERYAEAYYLLEKGQLKKTGTVREISSLDQHIAKFSLSNIALLSSLSLPYTLQGEDDVVVKVSSDKLAPLLSWLSDQILSGHVTHYSLSSMGLDETYEEGE